MNIIFTTIIVLSTICLIFINPNKVLSSMLLGGEKALELTLRLIVIYAIWMGVFELLEKTGIAKKFSNMLKPCNRLLFGELPEKANDYVSMNISANILGISGATTPMGINAVNTLCKSPNLYCATCMFFVINATSVQLIPSSVLALRTSMNASTPADIILPTILATLLSSVIGILFVKIFIKKDKEIL